MLDKLGKAIGRLTLPQHRLPLLLFLVSGLLYFNTWSNNYTFGDEAVTTSTNELVQLGVNGIGKIFSQSDKSWFDFIPLTQSTFAMEYSLFGLYPPFGNFIQIFLFALTAVLLFSFVKRIFPNSSEVVWFLSVLLFAVHPIHTSVVNNFAGRAELLGLIFVLLSSLNAFKWVVTNKPKQLMLSVVFAWLTMLSDPTFLPWFLIPLIVLTVIKKAPNKKVLMVFGAYAFAMLTYGAWRFGSVAVAHISALENPLVNLRNTPESLPSAIGVASVYLKQLLYPHPMCSIYGYGSQSLFAWSDPQVILSLAGFITLGFVALSSLKKNPLVFLGVFILLIDVLPFTNIFFLQPELADEKVLYGGTVGLSLILTAAFEKLFGFNNSESLLENYRSKPVARYVIGFIFLVAIYTTANRNFDWLSNYLLARVDVQTQPKSAKLNYLAAHFTRLEYLFYSDRNLNEQMEFAEMRYAKAVSIYPEWNLPRLELANLYLYDRNESYEALPMFELLLQKDSTFIEARLGLANALTNVGQFGEAIKEFGKILEYEPKNKEAINQIVGLYFTQNRLDGARLFNQRFFQFHPDAYEPYVHQANLSLAEGDTALALSYFDEALARNQFDFAFKEYVSEIRSSFSGQSKEAVKTTEPSEK